MFITQSYPMAAKKTREPGEVTVSKQILKRWVFLRNSRFHISCKAVSPMHEDFTLYIFKIKWAC